MAPKHEKAKQDSEAEAVYAPQDAGASLEKFLNPNYAVEFMGKLPKRIRERAQVLLHYHEEYEKLRKEFEAQETALRRKYDEVFLPTYERRKEIVAGTGQPVTDEEIAKGFPEDHAGKVDITSAAVQSESAEVPKGVAKFWLRVLQHHVLSGFMIEEHDEKVLEYLIDIRSGVIDGGYGSIAVAFTFAPNPFFPEETLIIQVVQQEKETKIIRTAPTWNSGMNVTEKQVKKGGPRGKKGSVQKTVTVSQPSFFNIFEEKGDNDDENDDDDDDDDDEEIDDEQVEQLMQVLHTSVIPNAVNCFTGEAPDGSSDLESDDDDEEEEEEEEDEEMIRPPPKGSDKLRGGHRGGAPRGGRGGAGGQECTQQ